MDIIIIPVVIIIIGASFMIFMNKRGKQSQGVAQEVMKNFVREQIPVSKLGGAKIINLLEDSLNPQHMWVVAYNQDGMHLIPAKSNPISQTINKYEDETPIYDINKWLGANLFAGNKSEEYNYIPFSAITSVFIDEKKKKIQINIAETSLKLKYQNKDCFGADQESEIRSFLIYLNQKTE